MANRIHVNVVILALSLLHATLCLGTEEVKFLTEAGQLFRVVLHSEEKTEHLNAPVKGSSGSSEKNGDQQSQLRQLCMPEHNFKSSQHFLGAQFRARVVDNITKQPIDGALALALWGAHSSRSTDMSFGSGYGGTAHAAETLTDKDGYFVIPAWGPSPIIESRPVKKLALLSKAEYHISIDPQLTVFKIGYSIGINSAARQKLSFIPLIPKVATESRLNQLEVRLQPINREEGNEVLDEMNARAEIAKSLGETLNDLSTT